MARIKNGILGGFNGKVGEVIGQNYAGVSTMRAMPKYVTNPRTEAQTEHRDLFKTIVQLMKGANSVLRFSNENRNKVYNGFNSAVKFNWANAIANGQIVLEELTFGTFWGGELDNLVISSSWKTNTLSLSLAWDDETNLDNKFETDQICLIAILHDEHDNYSVVGSGFIMAIREDGNAQQDIVFDRAIKSTETVSVYVGVNSYKTYEKYVPRKGQKPGEVVTIPANNGVHFSSSVNKYCDYYHNKPHWFTNIVGTN